MLQVDGFRCAAFCVCLQCARLNLWFDGVDRACPCCRLTASSAQICVCLQSARRNCLRPWLAQGNSMPHEPAVCMRKIASVHAYYCVHAKIACFAQCQLVLNSTESLAFLVGGVSVHVLRQVPLRKRPVPLRIAIGANRSVDQTV